MKIQMLTVVPLLSSISIFLVEKSAAGPIPGKTKQIKRFKYRECATKSTKAIDVQRLEVMNPMPLSIPGEVFFRLLANVTRTIPNNVNINVKLQKRGTISQGSTRLNFWTTIPCFFFGLPRSNYGSSTNCQWHDVPTCSVVGPLFGCPVEKRYYEVHNSLPLPDPGYTLRRILPGHYKAMVKIRHPVTRKLLACIKGRFSITNAKRRRPL